MKEQKEYTPGLFYKTVKEKENEKRANVAKLNNAECMIRLDPSILEHIGLYLIPVVQENKIGFIDATGCKIVEPSYDEIRGQFWEQVNIVAVRKGKMWSVINSEGSELLPFKYTNIIPSKDSTLATLQTYTGYSVIDTRTGKVIVEEGEYGLIEGFRFGCARVERKRGELIWGLINAKGKLVKPIEYIEMDDFYDIWPEPTTRCRKSKDDNYEYPNLLDLN